MRAAVLALVLPVVASALGAACSGDGGSGTCINKDTQSCSGILVANLCTGPANIECCVTDWGNCPGGTCQPNSHGCKGHYVTGECPGPSEIECCVSGAPGGLNRSVIMARAQQWVDAQIPYCQCSGGPPTECCGVCPYCADYRCDCSGYVSFTWELGRGYTTSTLPEVSHQISKDELLPGDVLLNAADHVVLFGGWADANHDTYYGFQEPGCHTTGPHYAFKSIIPYPFNEDPSLFLPYRYNNVAK